VSTKILWAQAELVAMATDLAEFVGAVLLGFAYDLVVVGIQPGRLVGGPARVRRRDRRPRPPPRQAVSGAKWSTPIRNWAQGSRPMVTPLSSGLRQICRHHALLSEYLLVTR